MEHYQVLTTLLTGSVGSLYVEILWVTMFILENCFIYFERQMSFSLAMAGFECRDLAPIVKERPILFSFYPLLS